MKKTIIILVIIIILIIIIALSVILFKQKNIEIEGDYTGYQLILDVKYDGWGIDGQYLKGWTDKKIYNISEGDILYEPLNGGFWLLNNSTDGIEILEIMKFQENGVEIKDDYKTYYIEYGEEARITTNSFIATDGMNYSYVIKVIKN